MSEARLLCTFTLGDQLFGVDVKRVQEVLRQQPMTRVPLAPRFIRGLINLRGQIVMAIDLRRCLEMADNSPAFSSMYLVLRTEDGPVSFLVDKIHDVVTVDGTTFEPPPPNLQGSIRNMIRGSYALPEQLLLDLDADTVLTLIDPPAAIAARAV